MNNLPVVQISCYCPGDEWGKKRDRQKMFMDSSLSIGQASAMARKQSKVDTKLYQRLVLSSKDAAKQQKGILCGKKMRQRKPGKMQHC